jgi:hypothetical protein
MDQVKDTRERAIWEHENGRVIPGATEWLREHWEEYAGQWVALGPSGLVAAAETFAELKAKVGHFKGLVIDRLV